MIIKKLKKKNFKRARFIKREEDDFLATIKTTDNFYLPFYIPQARHIDDFFDYI